MLFVRIPFRPFLLLIAFSAIGASGCAAVLIGGAVAGGAAGYAYYRGDVWKDFPAPFDYTWAATHAALGDLALPVIFHENELHEGTIESRSQTGDKISIRLTPASDSVMPATRVHVRVGVFGDQSLSEQIHLQIAARLQQPATLQPPLQPASTNQNLDNTITPISADSEIAIPKETAPPPLDEPQRQTIPASGDPLPFGASQENK